MTALHKSERATYGQAVEAQGEYVLQVCLNNAALCVFDGSKDCC